MKWAIVPLLIVAGVGTYYAFQLRRAPEVPGTVTPPPTAPAPYPTSTPQPKSTSRYPTSSRPSTEQAVIQQLKAQWQSISKSVPFSPILGSTAWWLDAVQFIGNSRILIQFEDGHVVHGALLAYADNRFKVIRSFPEPDFSYSDWEQVVKRYGDLNYAISTYSWNSDSRSYTRVSENVFISNRRP